MKNCLLVVLCLISLNIFAQRIIMFEEGTNTNCGPCASSNPGLDALITANPDKMVALKYHAWWPGAVNDPFYLHNTAENKVRINYYGWNGVPSIAYNGNTSIDYPFYAFTQNLINQLALEPTPFDLKTYIDVDKTNKIIKVLAIIKATDNFDASVRLFVAVAENVITLTSAPGTNGEKVFHDVFVKFLSSSAGDILPASWEAGDYRIFEYELDYSTIYVYDEDQLDIRAFIQNPSSKVVYQASRGLFAEVPTDLLPYSDDLEAMAVLNVPGDLCLPVIHPSITIRNNGNTAVTSATISYNVNNETVYEYEWSGTLNSLASTTIDLSEIEFDLESTNSFNFTIETVNGGQDSFEKNNAYTYTINTSANTFGSVRVYIRTDGKPAETTWQIEVTETGEIVANGGPYDTPNKMYTIPVTLAEGAECYVFKIFDAGGDGICCSNGSGFYGLESNTGAAMFSGGEFGSAESRQFSGNVTLGIQDIENNSLTSVYPNPAKDNLTVVVNVSDIKTASIDILSIVGKRVFSQTVSNLSSGKNEININTSNMPSGIYFVNIKYKNTNEVHKLNIIK